MTRIRTAGEKPFVPPATLFSDPFDPRESAANIFLLQLDLGQQW